MASLNTVAVIWQTGKVLTYLVVWQVHSLLYVSTSLATHDANEKLHMYFQDYESQGTIVFLDNFVIPEIGNCKKYHVTSGNFTVGYLDILPPVDDCTWLVMLVSGVGNWRTSGIGTWGRGGSGSRKILDRVTIGDIGLVPLGHGRVSQGAARLASAKRVTCFLNCCYPLLPRVFHAKLRELVNQMPSSDPDRAQHSLPSPIPPAPLRQPIEHPTNHADLVIVIVFKPPGLSRGYRRQLLRIGHQTGRRGIRSAMHIFIDNFIDYCRKITETELSVLPWVTPPKRLTLTASTIIRDPCEIDEYFIGICRARQHPRSIVAVPSPP
ncbi:hypothetical protein CIB48_g4084 [Xylaria polymorpha]|nr:hypothetical protein CIB48_g4084 [Xylaria polymorpha]